MKSGITQKQLSALEAGKTKAIAFETLAKLCQFFSCTPNDLLEIEELPPTVEELAQANEIIARGLARAMQAPKRSADEIWAEFEAVRARIAANDTTEETLAAQ
ncbi:MAG: helix-turn-helix domain-containing protein [Chroococcidiopsidaceae cyanobacterium CP_BM_RX_35]|nr:helix-turn-helix domain-containing protein [Chroococcidiopsidaceae cyanobacterium CP_BM_RX_35]